jgi:hypothetical protein
MTVNTFYAALGRGQKVLKARAEMWLDKLENDKTLDKSEEEKEIDRLRFTKQLALVADFKRKE